MLKRLIKNRKGTAEVIGSIMFIVILLFFFTNVYLWHDGATKQMNDLYVKKMNAGMTMSFDNSNNQVTITVTPQGSNVKLSRLWIDTSSNHVHADLEHLDIQVVVNKPITITFDDNYPSPPQGASVNPVLDGQDSSHIIIQCHNPTESVKFTIVNTLGIAIQS